MSSVKLYVRSPYLNQRCEKAYLAGTVKSPMLDRLESVDRVKVDRCNLEIQLHRHQICPNHGSTVIRKVSIE